MKATGIVRKIDDLGRVVIPSELRSTLGIGEKEPLEIFVDGDRIILQKYAPGCVFCRTNDGLMSVWDKKICCDCAKRIASYGFNER